MTNTKLQDYLIDLFDCDSLESGEIKYIETFDERGILSSNHGIVLTMDDGSEFQMSLVKTK